ncbi:hypothetical protein V7166_11920 [Bacillus thuringiensis]
MKEVTFLFKSGATLEFVANSFNVLRNGFGEVLSVEWDCEGLEYFPAHVNTESVDAILVKELN